MKNETSLFIDESGDTGFKDGSSKYYILTFVIHNQCDNIEQSLSKINNLPVIHAGPLIRREEIYKDLTIAERQKMFRAFFVFVINLPIKIKVFYYNKKNFGNDIFKMQASIARDTFFYITNSFVNTDNIKIYYDNGQKLITKILNSVFALSNLNYEFKKNVIPCSYRLFQVADFASTIKLLELKMNSGELSKYESILINKRSFKNTYIRGIRKKENK